MIFKRIRIELWYWYRVAETRFLGWALEKTGGYPDDLSSTEEQLARWKQIRDWKLIHS